MSKTQNRWQNKKIAKLPVDPAFWVICLAMASVIWFVLTKYTVCDNVPQSTVGIKQLVFDYAVISLLFFVRQYIFVVLFYSINEYFRTFNNIKFGFL